MIRRHFASELRLITQDEHARLAGKLASQIGNSLFSGASSTAAILGISMHDCGWVPHDQHPTLNEHGQPRDVFETPRQLGLSIWEESADRAARRDDYAGLLVSLHSLALSVFATERSPIEHARWDMSDPRTRFEVNRFQHKQIELQESLRRRLGMNVDRPLKHGLAEESSNSAEQRLAGDFRWLQAMDMLSLCICCTTPPFAAIQPVIPRPGAKPVSIEVSRPSDELLLLRPWPFGQDEIRVEVPHRRLPVERYADEQSFRAAYAAAPVGRFTVLLRAHTM